MLTGTAITLSPEDLVPPPPTRRRAATVPLAALLAAGVTTGALAAPAQATGRSTLSGTVTLAGCAATPDQVALLAVPMVPSLGRPRQAPPAERPLPVEVSRTADPAVHHFEVPEARSGRVYQLRWRLTAPGCADSVATGARGGAAGTAQGAVLAAPGATTSIEIVTKSALQVYAGSPSVVVVDGVPRDNWAETDSIAYVGAVKRLFRWRPDKTGAWGEWQVSRAPFPAGGGCPSGTPPLLLARGVVAGGNAGSWTEFALTIPEPKPITAGSAMAFVAEPGVGTLPGPPTGPAPAALTTPQLAGTGSSAGALHVRVVPRPTPDSPACKGSVSREVRLDTTAPDAAASAATPLQVYGGANCGALSDVCSYSEQHWMAATAQPLTTAAEHVLFRWAALAPGTTTHGEWQLSTTPFPSTCADAPGLVKVGTAAYHPGPPSGNYHDWFGIPVGSLGLVPELTYYVRVVPHDGSKACSAPPSNTVPLVTKPYTAPDIELPPPPPAPPPTAGLTPYLSHWAPYQAAVAPPPWCWTIVHTHTVPAKFVDTPTGIAIAAADDFGQLWLPYGGTLQAGELRCLWPASDPGGLWGFVQDAFELVVDVVSFPAKAYEWAKDQIIAAVGSVVSELSGVSCEEATWCAYALRTALDAGLQAVGLPPSLPDADALIHEGEQYLIKKTAEQTGFKEELLAAGYELAKPYLRRMLAAASNAASGNVQCADWCLFDTRMRVPTATIRVVRSATDPAELPTPATVCVADVSPLRLLATGCASLPALSPGESVDVPIRMPAAGWVLEQVAWETECPPVGIDVPCPVYQQNYARTWWEARVREPGRLVTLKFQGGPTTTIPISTPT